jgi:hypothetical protein
MSIQKPFPTFEDWLWEKFGRTVESLDDWPNLLDHFREVYIKEKRAWRQNERALENLKEYLREEVERRLNMKQTTQRTLVGEEDAEYWMCVLGWHMTGW